MDRRSGRASCVLMRDYQYLGANRFAEKSYSANPEGIVVSFGYVRNSRVLGPS